jgi:uncharacterized protein (DUF2147 family)
LLGDWITPNKSIVEIYRCSEKVCLKIAHVDASVGHTVDGENPDRTKRSRPLCGLVIGTGFQEQDPSHADGGTLYDPESGHTYSGTIALIGSSTLRLHGFIGISLLGRTEAWQRAQTTPPGCK